MHYHISSGLIAQINTGKHTLKSNPKCNQLDTGTANSHRSSDLIQASRSAVISMRLIFPEGRAKASTMLYLQEKDLRARWHLSCVF